MALNVSEISKSSLCLKAPILSGRRGTSEDGETAWRKERDVQESSE